jgi:hypothetical protein
MMTNLFQTETWAFRLWAGFPINRDMKTTIKQSSILVLMIFMCGSWAQAQSGVTFSDFKDANGNPVNNVTIRSLTGSFETVTTSNGQATVHFGQSGSAPTPSANTGAATTTVIYHPPAKYPFDPDYVPETSAGRTGSASNDQRNPSAIDESPIPSDPKAMEAWAHQQLQQMQSRANEEFKKGPPK